MVRTGYLVAPEPVRVQCAVEQYPVILSMTGGTVKIAISEGFSRAAKRKEIKSGTSVTDRGWTPSQTVSCPRLAKSC